MAITTQDKSPFRIPRDMSGADDAMALSKSDANYLEHPDVAGQRVVTKGISLSINTDAIVVEMASGNVRTIPAGMLAPGVIHPIHITKLLSTGTGATVVVWGWF